MCVLSSGLVTICCIQSFQVTYTSCKSFEFPLKLHHLQNKNSSSTSKWALCVLKTEKGKLKCKNKMHCRENTKMEAELFGGGLLLYSGDSRCLRSRSSGQWAGNIWSSEDGELVIAVSINTQDGFLKAKSGWLYKSSIVIVTQQLQHLKECARYNRRIFTDNEERLWIDGLSY